jgi:hypothetical protein
MSSKYDHEIIHHDPSEGFDHTEPAARQITFFVVVSLITLAVVIGALQLYFNGAWDELAQERVLNVTPPELKDQRNLEDWRLTHYEYTTPEKTTVRIPLDRARELFLQEVRQGKTFYPARPTTPKAEEPPAAAAAKQETKQ